MLLEQDAIVDVLLRQSTENPDQIAFDAAIQAMADAEVISVPG